MPRTRRTAKTRRTELTEFQFWELLLGPGNDRGISDFESPFRSRAGWYENREELMEDPTPGMRPWGFWEYEVGHHPADVGMEGQAAELKRLGLLEDWEEAQLVTMKVRVDGRRRRRRSRHEGAEEQADPRDGS